MIYVKFTEVPFEGKTKLYVIEAVRGNMQLGYIKFYTQWRI
ncbi:hypothetical protein [Chryseobacterium sp. G0240]|nr:hypothetical protein [Chryseobacterium sp. G0240]